MILRRLTQHLKQQNWTAIAIELVILVLGVFLGLQVNNWNEARHDRAVEQQYLQRLYDDLQTTLAARNGEDARWDATRRSDQALVLSALRSGVLPEQDREAFDRGLLFFGYISGPNVRWATAEELQSTGAMAVIQDIKLRGLIGQLDANFKRRQGISATFTNSINGYRQEIGSHFSVIELKGFDSVRLQYDFPALSADPAFINSLSQIDALSRLKAETSQKVLDEVRVLRDEIAVRMGKPPGDDP